MRTKNKRTFGYIILLASFSFFLAGCGTPRPAMDEPGTDGAYRYQNKDLGFELSLPSDFEYYQTQRKAGPDYAELAIFVPTSDTGHPQEVPGYAKPVTIWVFDSADWEAVKNEEGYEQADQTVRSKDERTYVIRFWPYPPADWADKWDEDMAAYLLDSFTLL